MNSDPNMTPEFDPEQQARENGAEKGPSDYGTTEREGYTDVTGGGRGSSVTTGTTGGLGDPDDDELVQAGTGNENIDESDTSP